MKRALLLAVIFCGACSAFAPRLANKPSAINRDAAKLDGQVVTITGWMVLENEELAIWDQEKDRDANKHPDRCVSVLVPKSLEASLRTFNRKYVKLPGLFHRDVASMKPTMFFGLCNTTAIEVLPGRMPEIVSP